MDVKISKVKAKVLLPRLNYLVQRKGLKDKWLTSNIPKVRKMIVKCPLKSAVKNPRRSLIPWTWTLSPVKRRLWMQCCDDKQTVYQTLETNASKNK
jgi:hypothetical protein